MSADTDREKINRDIEISAHKRISFKSFFERSPLSYQSLDSLGQFLDVNPTWEKTFGYSRNEILGRKFSDFMTDTSGELVAPRFHTLKEYGEIGDVAFEMIHKDGSAIFVTLHGRASYDDSGNFLNTNCILIDITERSKIEKQLDWELHVNRVLSELAKALIDPGQSIKAVAKKVLVSARDLTQSEHGFVSEIDRVTGENVCHALTVMMGDARKIEESDQRVAFPIGEDGKYPKLWGSALNSGKPLLTNSPMDHPHASGLPEGHAPLARFLCIPVKYNEEVIGQIAIANPPNDYNKQHLSAIQRLADLYALAIFNHRSTENRIQVEYQMRQSQKMEAIGTMAGGIAHDFNNLLSIISGNIDVIQHKYNAGSYAEENVEHIKNAASRAKNLVAQILTFSRQEQLELVPVDLSIVINDSLKLLRSTTPSTVEIMTTIERSNVFVNADMTQLQQIFINLCTNAVYAMVEKGLLKIGLRVADLATEDLPAGVDLQTDPYVVISFSDTGSGMQKETIDKIFDPFFTTKPLGEGTGMGLSVVHGIVEQHGGFITVDSVTGEGTTFNLYFPMISATEVEQKVGTGESLPTGTERILFVDDEECIAYTCNELLGFQGYSVTSVTSSAEAFDLFNASPDDFDLVFTDQTMPGMSGSELAAKLLAIRPDIPIILCSGYSAKLSEVDAKEIGIREFCMKPMDIKQLAIVARKVLDESDKPK